MNKCEAKRTLLKYSLPPLSKDEEVVLFQKIQKGDKRAKEEIFRHNIRLVVYFLDRFYDEQQRVSLTYEDLLQVGCIGLLRAIEKRDVNNLDIAFSTYAEYWIMAYVKRTISEQEHIIRVPEETLRCYYKWRDGKNIEGRVEAVKDAEKSMMVHSLNITVPVPGEQEIGSELINILPQNGNMKSTEQLMEDNTLAVILRETIDSYVNFRYSNETEQEKTSYIIRAFFGFDMEPIDKTNIGKNGWAITRSGQT